MAGELEFSTVVVGLWGDAATQQLWSTPGAGGDCYAAVLDRVLQKKSPAKIKIDNPLGRQHTRPCKTGKYK